MWSVYDSKNNLIKKGQSNPVTGSHVREKVSFRVAANTIKLLHTDQAHLSEAKRHLC